MPGVEGLVAFALHALAQQLAMTTDGFRLLARATLGGLLVVATKLHFAENALALHLLLKCAKRLIHVIVTNNDLHDRTSLRFRNERVVYR